MAEIVVLGAGYGGLLAALRLGRQRAHRVTLVSASDQFVERVRLHQTAASDYQAEHPIAKLIAGTGIEFVQVQVTGMDTDRREILLGANGNSLRYDRLIYALGSATAARTPGVRDHAHTLGSPQSARRLHTALSEKTEGRLVVVGGGLTGIEAASEFAEAFPGWQVTLLTAGKFGTDLSARGQAHLRRSFDHLQIQVIEAARVVRVDPSAVVTSDGRLISFDACLWAGAFGVSPLARDSGLSVDAWDRLVIGADQRSISHPAIYGVGDAAASGLRMACATAMPMGAQAADNVLADLNGKPIQPLMFGYALRCISLGRRDALIQWVDHQDRPRESITTGRAGALVKEAICRFAFYSLLAEKRLPGVYPWMRSEIPPVMQRVRMGV